MQINTPPPSDLPVSLPLEGGAPPDAQQFTNVDPTQLGPPTDLPPDVNTYVNPSPAGTTASQSASTERGERKEHGFAALWRGVVKLATKIPWLGSTSAVQNAAKNIRMSDAAHRQIDAIKVDRFESFVQGLKSSYSEEAANVAIAVTGLSSKDYLTTTMMHQAEGEAMYHLAYQGAAAQKA